MAAYIRATWDVTPDETIYIEAVHRLSSSERSSPKSRIGPRKGFDAEWRVIILLTVHGDLINRCELFDETDLDAALARFDELSRPAPRLENAASRGTTASGVLRGPRLGRHGGNDRRRLCHDDRRRVVNSGIQQGRDAQIANMRAASMSGSRTSSRSSSRPEGSASP